MELKCKPMTKYFLIILLIGFSCKHEKVKISKGLHQDLIDDMVRNHFFSHFLGNHSEYDKLVEKYYKSDSLLKSESDKNENYNEFLDERQEIIEEFMNSKTERCILEIDSNYIKNKRIEYYQFERIPFKKEFIDIDSIEIIKKLRTPMSYDINTINSQYFKFGSLSKNQCDIGKIVLSEPLLNKTKSKGIIFCRFLCGKKCGYETVFFFENIKGVWNITKEEQIGVY